MKVLSLFSGIGAFEKALKNIGVDFELVNYCEINMQVNLIVPFIMFQKIKT